MLWTLTALSEFLKHEKVLILSLPVWLSNNTLTRCDNVFSSWDSETCVGIPIWRMFLENRNVSSVNKRRRQKLWISIPFNTYYNDVIMSPKASPICSLKIAYSTVYSGADQRKHQSSASLAFVRVIHRGPVNFPHKWPVTQRMYPFADVIMWKLDNY